MIWIKEILFFNHKNNKVEFQDTMKKEIIKKIVVCMEIKGNSKSRSTEGNNMQQDHVMFPPCLLKKQTGTAFVNPASPPPP